MLDLCQVLVKAVLALLVHLFLDAEITKVLSAIGHEIVVLLLLFTGNLLLDGGEVLASVILQHFCVVLLPH